MRKHLVAVLCAIGFTFAQAEDTTDGRLVVSGAQSILNVNGLPAIVGVAINQSETVLKNAFVQFNLFNAQGNQIGNTIAHVTNLAPGQTWQFSAPIIVPDAASFKISGIKTFQ